MFRDGFKLYLLRDNFRCFNQGLITKFKISDVKTSTYCLIGNSSSLYFFNAHILYKLYEQNYNAEIKLIRRM